MSKDCCKEMRNVHTSVAEGALTSTRATEHKLCERHDANIYFGGIRWRGSLSKGYVVRKLGRLGGVRISLDDSDIC